MIATPAEVEVSVILPGGATPASLTTVLTLTGVQQGDLIMIGVGRSIFTPVATWSCADTLGTVYGGPYWAYSPGNGTQQIVFFGYASNTGSCTITVTASVSSRNYGIAARWSDPFAFVQIAYSLGPYSTIAPYSQGQGSAAFNVAESVVITFQMNSGGWGVNQIASDTGDVEEGHTGTPDPFAFGRAANDAYLWTRTATGLGPPQNVELKRQDQGQASVNNTSPLTFVFSSPLARPGGLTTQSAVRPGEGMAEFDPAAEASYPSAGPLGVETNRPLVVALRYLPLGPLLGVPRSFLFVPVSRSGGVVSASVVGDDYGNTYTYQGSSPGFGGVTIIDVYTTLVDFLPPDGEVFQVRVTEAASSSIGIYQTTSIGIQEHVLSPNIPGTYQLVPWDHNVVASEVTLVTEILPVPVGTLLLAFAAWRPSSVQTQINWTALDGYSIEEKWELTQYPFAIVNDPRLTSCAILYKFSVGGDETASIEAAMTVDGGNIALLAVTIAPGPPTPPTTSPCDESNITPAPETDNQFELMRAVATIRQARHLPVR